ncbi:hypothetical protein D3C81_2303200 [compost metagenome]
MNDERISSLVQQLGSQPLLHVIRKGRQPPLNNPMGGVRPDREPLLCFKVFMLQLYVVLQTSRFAIR